MPPRLTVVPRRLTDAMRTWLRSRQRMLMADLIPAFIVEFKVTPKEAGKILAEFISEEYESL
jgi:hypothetical protein